MDVSDWQTFETTTTSTGIEESKGNLHRRIASDVSTSPLREKQARAARSKFTNDGVDEHDVSPSVAFEVFAGKQFFTPSGDTTSTDLSDSVAKKKQAHSVERERVRRLESPLERYYRLKREVDELAEDVAVMTQPPTDSEGQDQEAAKAPWSDMASGLLVMQQQLNALSQTSAMKAAGLSLPNNDSAQSVLSRRLLSEVSNMKQTATTTTAEGEGGEGGGGG